MLYLKYILELVGSLMLAGAAGVSAYDVYLLVEFRIAVRIPEATYYHDGLVIPSGEQSPIGTRWIGLNQAGFGIHGTNAPGSIGRAASHGCIRMRNRDAEELFEMVRVGDVVEIRDEEVAELVGEVAGGM